MTALTPDLLIRAYAGGIFPMAESGDSDEIFWVDPKERGILPLDAFHIPHRLKRTLRADRFEIACDRDFTATMRACAEATATRPSTWINDEIIAVYSELHRRGLAHSVEARLGGDLAGGLYGVALGGAFFGESMFSRATDASKIALAHLVARLRHGGFALLDTQFVTKHLRQFGAVTVSRAAYRRMLAKALLAEPRWHGEAMTGAAVAELLPKEARAAAPG